MHDFSGMRITIMGLGIHGGGAAAAEYCVRHGADVTVTDLKDEGALHPSIERLAPLRGIRFVLGRHEDGDFTGADMVIKNPAVPRSAFHLGLARTVETDISLYLSATRSRIIGVTGTKGKSTTAGAAHHILRGRGSRLGGNITVSPLTFLDEERHAAVTPAPPAVLELSSFQLGDLRLTSHDGARPAVGILTSFMRDHQDYYHSMADYREDKEELFRMQISADWMIIDPTADYAPPFLAARRGPMLAVGARPAGSAPSAHLDGGRGILVDAEGLEHEVLPDKMPIPGPHNRLNLLYAAAAAWVFGEEPEAIRAALATFAGVPHRMEALGLRRGLRFINDSAATVPEAALAGVSSFREPVYLICGGADKNLDYSLFAEIADKAAGCYLLSGSASERIAEILVSAGRSFGGPFDNLPDAVAAAVADAPDESVVLLSPGCASFGMFRNEFDRGDQFREIVRSL